MQGQVHHVHVVGVRVTRRVRRVMVVVAPAVVIVIVWGGKVWQGRHVGGGRQPRHDHLMVHPALGGSRRVAGVGGDEQGGLHRLGLRRRHRVGVGGVFRGWTHAGPLDVGEGLRWRTHPLP